MASLRLFVLLALALPLPGYAYCLKHNPWSESVPLCPDTGARILNEGYPASALVIGESRSDPAYAVGMVKKVFEADPKNPPLVVLRGRSKRKDLLLLEMEKALPAGTDLSFIRYLPYDDESPFHWNQDIFQSFVDEGGRGQLAFLPAVKATKQHTDIQSLYADTARTLVEACETPVAPFIPDPSNGKILESSKGLYVIPNGMAGGNLEGGPGGTCIVGTGRLPKDFHQQYAKSVCGSAPLVAPNTDWLRVGHADELGTTIRTGNGPCDEVYLLASPRKALELMAKNPKGKAFPDLKGARNGSWITHVTHLQLCQNFLHKRKAGELVEDCKDCIWKEQGATFQFLQDFLRHEGKPHKERYDVAVYPKDIDDCKDMTNGDFLQVFKGLYGSYNQSVQPHLDAFKKDLLKEWKKAKPECHPKIVEVPVLFYDQERARGKDHPEKVTLGAFYKPFAGNGLQVGKTYIGPDPLHEDWAMYLRGELKKYGLKTEFQDVTFTVFPDTLDGGLHCLTKAVRYCRPR